MRKIDLLLAEYGESHRNATNKLIHWICVPLIFWTILGFISYIPTPNIYLKYYGFLNVASFVALTLVTIFYFRLSWRIAIIMIFIMLLMEHFVSLANVTFGTKSWIFYLTIFVITWILQFVGHKIEGKKPSFLKDLQFLLIGPIWLLSFFLKKLGIRY
ncbi:hypothetical protein IX39_09485 [Chryseobacterium formosense]|uniref:DUF962 domain-containing protein n=1 Tax=Chryseobacterium formosense TaxID=236814 RepID=A0A085Z8R9_9FLAO|nr:Mpo1-like protein [Chryseobacterium formosense]KFF00833.1 hypothetical protein IX39_09485 [Chryseobacterium formosense]SFT38425.1 Uncharacterized membrane protein YGL010W [Chryseobacterium formosense]